MVDDFGHENRKMSILYPSLMEKFDIKLDPFAGSNEKRVEFRTVGWLAADPA